MASGAQLSVTDQRLSSRYPVRLSSTGEHRTLGELALQITNISATGCMVEDGPPSPAASDLPCACLASG